MKLVNMHDSKSCAARLVGSTPTIGTALITMSKANAKKIVKKYAIKLKTEKYPFSAVYLFGSHARNRNNKWSDIDVAVISDKLKSDWWKNEMLLSHLSLDVDSRIEPRGFTVKGFEDDSDPLVYEIKKTGVRVV